MHNMLLLLLLLIIMILLQLMILLLITTTTTTRILIITIVYAMYRFGRVAGAHRSATDGTASRSAVDPAPAGSAPPVCSEVENLQNFEKGISAVFMEADRDSSGHLSWDQFEAAPGGDFARER